MIPRLKADLGAEEVAASFFPGAHTVQRFEKEFAKKFDAEHGIAFSYGRSGLYYLIKALGLKDAEIIMPAYTCVVVAHAAVLSGNVPKFIDASFTDFNMDLDRLAEAITGKTGMIVATHLFGYPLDIPKLEKIVRDAEARLGKKIYVVQDCAHSFGTLWHGLPVAASGDAALYGLNISKIMTTVFGGMIITRNDALAEKLRKVRDGECRAPSAFKTLGLAFYGAAAWLSFKKPLYGLVYYLEHRTPFLKQFTQYYRDDKIDMPKDFRDKMPASAAAVGLVQLRKYDHIVAHRRMMAHYYAGRLNRFDDLLLPPLVEGATYSHYVCRTAHRDKWLVKFAEEGVQLGTLYDYVIPGLSAYRRYASGSYPVAETLSREALNFPVHASVQPADIDRALKRLSQ